METELAVEAPVVEAGGADRAAVMVVIGTRPEAIKMLPVVEALQSSDRLRPWVVSTGQHPDAVAETLAYVGAAPDVALPPGDPGRSLNGLFAAVLVGIEGALREQFGPPVTYLTAGAAATYPLAAVVHGDTSSAAAGALAAFHLRMPVAHVEAGLRTHQTYSPYPEEINRQLIARIAALHFAPTTVTKENLIREGVDAEQVFVTGNTAIDALLRITASPAPIANPVVAEVLERLDHTPGARLVVVTAHRRENWGDGLDGIAAAIARLATDNPDVTFVLPMHFNPAVRHVFLQQLQGLPSVVLCEPLEYRDFAQVLRRATMAISDSGGIQEEAPAVGTPVLVTRQTTERAEGVAAGTLRLVGTDPTVIVAAAQELLDDPGALAHMTGAPNPYGDGMAGSRIVEALENVFFRTPKPRRFGPGYSRAAVLEALGLRPTGVPVT